ncbi:putative methionine--tRNA ligase [Dioscorea sansibarensis]
MAAGRTVLASSHAGLRALAPFPSSLSLRSLSLRGCGLSRLLSSYARCCAEGSAKPVEAAAVEDRFVVTTPLYYVNAPPHMGSAYTTIAADSIARFQRLLGKRVIFVTGTDEHGEKIAAAAVTCGNSPIEHCDTISHSYQSLWKDLEISYDKFIRTTDSSHEVVVKEFYSRVLNNGDIYRADYEGLYCVNCEEYKDEKELLENNCCTMHLKPCIKRKEDNFFFALSKYQKSLEDMLACNPDFVKPSYRLNEVQGWIKNGLRDFSISRSSVEWGIPVPNDTKQTIYVWFDALLGYISALLEAGEQPTLEKAIHAGWPASLHLIGMDILRFHAVYWPAMLMSARLTLPKMVFGHGFLTKMGKSLGNTIEPNDLVNRFGSDAVRYFFLREVEFGNDGDYSEDRFISIGNLLNRTLGLLKKNCQSTLDVDSTAAAEGNSLRDTIEKLVEKARIHYENLLISSACESVLEIGNAGNLYIDERAPWSLFKQGGTSSEMAAKDLVVILEAMRIIAIALSPVTPSLCLRIYKQLGFSEDEFKAVTWNDTKWGGLRAGQIMAEPKPVFAKIENRNEDKVEVAPNVARNKKKTLEIKG